MAQKNRKQRRRFVPLALVAVPLVWMSFFFVIPFMFIARMSLSHTAQAQPPYRPIFEGFDSIGQFLNGLSFDNFALLFSDDLYGAAIVSSLKIASLATIIALLIGYPLAYAIAQAPRRSQGLLIMLIMLPFWTSFLIRVYAWLIILKPEGLFNSLLLAMGFISAPLDLLNRDEAVILGIVYAYLPFMVLPLYAVLERMDRTLIEAAQDLGAPAWKAFLTITLPLSWPGIVAGSALVLIPAIGEFVIPDLLGGSDTLMIGHVLWGEFFSNRDWPLASALAIALLGLVLTPLMVAERFILRKSR